MLIRTILVCIVFLAPLLASLSARGEGQAKAFDQKSHDQYIERLKRKLDDNWYVPDGNNKVTIISSIDGDGTVSDIEVVSKPKSEPAEQASNEAFVKAQPFESLPSGTQKAKLTVVFRSEST
ncbi:MAG: TonB C-terminal domain-containing protein, partial [Candidatus Obscuribacterales bacterium]|nr:TonB C-terminal domain-containing protein [Candidatus Obscuribacterales bacterium]